MSCTHLMLEVSPKYRPYRYVCVKCSRLLKIASGVHIACDELWSVISQYRT